MDSLLKPLLIVAERRALIAAGICVAFGLLFGVGCQWCQEGQDIDTTLDSSPESILLLGEIDGGSKSRLSDCSFYAGRFPDAPIVILADRANDIPEASALGAGASLVISLEDLPTQISEKISKSGILQAHYPRTLDKSAALPDPARLGHWQDDLLADGRKTICQGGVGRLTAGGLGRGDALSIKEEQIAGHLSRGLTNRQIADKLFLSPETIKTHVRHIFKKLGAANRTELASLLTQQEVAPDQAIYQLMPGSLVSSFVKSAKIDECLR